MQRPWLGLGLAVFACHSPAEVVVANRADRVASPAPRIDSDRDGDGIADAVDRCPDQPEDYDAFQDADGCPDPDNDGDGVPDGEDDCPYEAGPSRGCVHPCMVSIKTNDDCILDPTVFYDASGVPQPARIREIVRLMQGNPSVQGLEVLGTRAELVTVPLRAQLPRLEIVENHRDIGIANAIYVRITKQRFDEGRFRSTNCSSFGPIYHPARADNCTR